MNPIIPVLGDLRLAGNLVADQNNISFPANPKVGTLVARGLNLYVFIEVNGILSWYPIVSLSGNVYQNTQAIPSDKWVVTHNLNTAQFWYQAQDGLGNIIVPTTINQIDSNSFEAVFPAPIAGSMVVVATSNMVVDQVYTNLIQIGANITIDVAGIMIGGKRVMTGGVSTIVGADGKKLVFSDQTPLKILPGANVTIEINDFDKSITIGSHASTTKADLGLDKVANVSPADMPVSAAQANADAQVLTDAKAHTDATLGHLMQTTVVSFTQEIDARNKAIADSAAALKLDYNAVMNAAISHEVAVRDEALAIEAATRKAADDALLATINTTLGSVNTTETADRIAADAVIATNLNAEITRAKASESVLAASIANEVTDRTNAVTALITAINNEASARTSAVNTVAGTVTAETTRAQAAETTLTTNLNAEITNRINAVKTVADSVTAETTNRINGDTNTLSAAKLYADGLLVGMWNDRGNYSASVGVYPSIGGSGTNGAVRKGDIWTVTVPGKINNVSLYERQTLRALVNAPGNVDANWAIGLSNMDIDDAIAIGVTSRAPSQNAVGLALDAESVARVTADNKNAADIVAETTARNTAITQEVVNRNAVIAVETTRATAAETKNANDILAEATARASAITAAINQEVTDRNAAIAVETNQRIAADAALQASIDTQIAAANSTITTLDLNIQQVSNSLSIEVTRATAAEIQLASNLTNGDAATLANAKAYAQGLVVGLWEDCGNYDASVNTFPSAGGSGAAGAVMKGDIWTISVAGTLGNVPVAQRQTVRAMVDNPGQTTANWAIGLANTDIEDVVVAGVTGKAPSQNAVFQQVNGEAAARQNADALLVPKTTKINGKALSADISLTSSDVGAIPATSAGAANGVAPLDANKKIPITYMSSSKAMLANQVIAAGGSLALTLAQLSTMFGAQILSTDDVSVDVRVYDMVVGSRTYGSAINAHAVATVQYSATEVRVWNDYSAQLTFDIQIRV